MTIGTDDRAVSGQGRVPLAVRLTATSGSSALGVAACRHVRYRTMPLTRPIGRKPEETSPRGGRREDERHVARFPNRQSPRADQSVPG